MMVIDGTIAMTMASLTALAVAWRDGRGTDARAMDAMVTCAMIAVLSFHGATRTGDKRDLKATRRSAIAALACGTWRSGRELWARFIGANERNAVSWTWSEGASVLVEKALGVSVKPGMFYPAFVNAEVLCELAFVVLPLGAHLMCVGIDRQSKKKER